MKKFLLTKYYMDCVTPEGDVILCYASDLALGRIRLAQSSLLINSKEKGTQTRQSFFRGIQPRFIGEEWI